MIEAGSQSLRGGLDFEASKAQSTVLLEREEDVGEQPVFSQEAPLNQQVAEVGFLCANGLFWEITPGKFPALPPLYVAERRFFTTHQAIESLESVRQVAQNPALQEKLDIWITQLIQERDTRFLSTLEMMHGEADPSAIARNMLLRRPAEPTRWLNQLIEWGFYDEVDEQKFPELLSLRPPNRVFLKLYAVSVRRQRLKFMKNEGETSSFSGFSPYGEFARRWA